MTEQDHNTRPTPSSQPSTFSLPLRPRVSNDGTMASSTAKSTSAPRLASPGISVEFHGDGSSDANTRPLLAPHYSAPGDMQKFKSPMRHHKRTPSAHREIKETLNARSEYMEDNSSGHTHYRINQYVIKDEIGRGSFGAVHLATDQFGKEYAVKEFSKSRLRKRAQSNILRHGPRRFGRFPPRPGFGVPDDRLSKQQAEEDRDALFLIREEIAIMKKLNHPNLVQLVEVLDDPEGDSMYMVLDMCKKGVVMKVGLHERADPLPEEMCRTWFRDLILGIEYLHSQGVVHRDIKPDNLLLTEDDVLKIVDFGVSEMFQKSDDMRTAKPAGSPAFLPPELCVAKHGDVSGKAADIWSMGVSLYCFRYGQIPFECDGVLEMYEAIKTQEPYIPPDEGEQFKDLMHRLLEKDPKKRITMAELREHPWVTKDGTDPLLSAEENCSDPVEPNPLDVNHAFTRKMSHLLCVMKAIRKFKSLLAPKNAHALSNEQTEVGKGKGTDRGDAEAATPRASEGGDDDPQQIERRSTEEFAAKILEERKLFLKKAALDRALNIDLDRHLGLTKDKKENPQGHTGDPPLGRRESIKITMALTPTTPGASDTPTPKPDHGDSSQPKPVLHLGIGTGGIDDFSSDPQPPADFVSDSPTAVDFDVYDRAFDDEVERIKRSTSRKGHGGELYHTRLNRRGHGRLEEGGGGDDDETRMTPRSLVSEQQQSGKVGNKFADLVAQAVMRGAGPEKSAATAGTENVNDN